MNLPVLRRNCGFCTACCSIFEIQEIGKPGYTSCQCLAVGSTKKKCTIYKNRPAACKAFFCEWLLSHIGNEEDRPDKLGVILNYRSGTKFADVLLVAEEIRENAFLESRAYTLLSALAEKELILLRSKTTRKLIGPESQLAKAAEIVSKATAEQSQLAARADEATPPQKG